MLNPDGVINGSYRCNLAGHDLNKAWGKPNSKLDPTINAAKRLLLKLRDRITLFCDFHGHTKKLNSFIYGCHTLKDEGNQFEFPYIMSKISRYFDYNSCK